MTFGPAAAADAEPHPPDAELLRAVAGGDRGALAELYRRHAGWLTIRLERRCGDAELADQALQDTFVAVWKSASSFRGEGDVGAWLWGIGVRRLIDLLRKQKPAVETEVPAPSPSAEQVVVDGQLSGPIAVAIAQLSPELRQTFLATHIDQLTTKEVGVLLDIPQGTVKTRLARARQLLQQSLAPSGEVA